MQKVIQIIESNKDTFIEDLSKLLRIKSISGDSEYNEDIKICTEYLIHQLEALKFNNIKILNTDGHPIIYAERIYDPKAKTVLIYGHYDVQPVDPIEEWNSPPFEPVIKNGKIYARGATDDKGQFYTHFKSIDSFSLANEELPLNIKFLIEGEEEIGSISLPKIIKKYKDLLKCDVVLVSDTSMYSKEIPSITCSLRGLAYFQIELTGPNKDLHSGTYGGGVHNPIDVLCNILSKMKNSDGKILVPHFYDDVIRLTKEDRKELAKIEFNEKKYMRELGLKALFGEKGFTTIERTTCRPSFEINGIWGGYIKEGAKTVIPSKAYAKVSFRLVANQKLETVTKLVKNYLKKITPKTVKLDLIPLHGGEPAYTPPNNQFSIIAAKSMEKAFGKYPLFTREGGSIPIVVEFMKYLDVPVILLGFGLDSEDAHSPNEHLSLDHYIKGIKCSAYFLKELSEMK